MKTPRRLITLGLLLLCIPSKGKAEDLRLGIIGTDSSHAVEFTRIFNDASAADHVAGARIVAAYRGGNPSLPLSRDRIARFTGALRDRWNIPFVSAIRDLCPHVDGILLLSVDAGPRIDEFRQAAACGKPIFIDKPLALTFSDAQAIHHLAARRHVRWFSSSSFRFGVAQSLRSADIRSLQLTGPGALQPGYPLDLAWYGIHSIELLFTIMGPDVESVRDERTADADNLTAQWTGHRTATLHLIRPDSTFSIVVQRTGGTEQRIDSIPIGYAPLLRSVVEFVRTGHSPVPPQETLQIFAFMDAAQQSLTHSGAVTHVKRIR